MVIMEPCGRLKVILMQMIDDIVAGARPGNKEEFARLMEEMLPGLEKRAYKLAEECRASGGCEKMPCDICDANETQKFFRKAYTDLESRRIRYEEIKKGDPHIRR
jgi:hypothetical protein